MKKILILFCLLSFPAHAWLLLEGNVGYGMSNKWEKKNYTDIQYDGMVVNGRLGFKVLKILTMGGEYSWADNNFEYMDSGSGIGYKVPAPRTDLGVFVGIDLTLLRFWGTYYIKSQLKMDNLNGTRLDGTGFGLGVAWTFLPFVSINGEWRQYEYNSSVGDISLSDSDKLTGDWFLISLGFYVDLL